MNAITLTEPVAMPEALDKAERRRQQIMDAVLALIAREGMVGVTMRAVAKEAGVSLRLVQYYFTSKANLLAQVLQVLEAGMHARWRARLDAMPGHAMTRAYLEAFILEALPLTAESRLFHLAWTSYGALAMTDHELSCEPFIEGPNRLERLMIERLIAGRREGDVPQRVDAAYEAARIIALCQGLASSVLVGKVSGEAAITLMHVHIDAMLEPDELD